MNSPRRFEDELARALEHAPFELYSPQVPHITEDGRLQDLNQHSIVADFDDDVKLGVNMGLKPALNGVETADVDEFADLLAAAVDLADVPGYDIEGTVRHESKHDEAWRAIGVNSCKYTVTLIKLAYTEDELRDGIYEIGFQPHSIVSDIVAPKLAVAAMNVRPYDPSETDMAAALSFGYSGVQDIGDRILRFNQQYPDTQLLLPESYEK